MKLRPSLVVNQSPRVLFLSPPLEDYLADGVLHGLRSVLGGRAVDYPKHEVLYETTPPEVLDSIRGHGFSLYGRLPDIPIDRARVLEQARWGQFDLVIIGSINLMPGRWLELVDQLPHTPIAVLDGDDAESPYPYRGRYWRRPYLWTLPRAHRRAMYFKRELTPRTASYRCFRLVPDGVAAKLPVIRRIHPIAFSIPEDNIVAELPEKLRDFPSHIVDPEVARRVRDSVTGAPPGAADAVYAFGTEEAYVADLRAARFGITTKRGGWDALRHYEIAAAATVPCFRDLDAKPTTCAPHGLDRTNCIVYCDADDLFAQIAALSDAGYTALQEGALAWVRRNTTVARARELLARIRRPA